MDDDLLDYTTFLILDTNVLLDHLDTISRFAEDVPKNKKNVKIKIPGVVIRELDGQKARDRLGWPSRRATRWILTNMKEGNGVLQCQALHETMKSTGEWSKRELGSDETNDDLILDYARYISQSSMRTILCTSDMNLHIHAQANGLKVMTPGSPWSSRRLAAQIRLIEEHGSDSKDFADQQAKPYNTVDDVMDVEEIRTQQTRPPPPEPDDMAMDVDDEGFFDQPPALLEKMTPSEALRLLHLQVIEQYTGLIQDVIARRAGHLLDDNYMGSRSRWAADYAKKPYKAWTLKDRLDYLVSQAAKFVPKKSTSDLARFLSMPYSNGGRRGDDWPPRTWEESLQALADLGNAFNDPSFSDSMEALDEPFHELFKRRLVERP